jgi:prevent-host-death family protein
MLYRFESSAELRPEHPAAETFMPRNSLENYLNVSDIRKNLADILNQVAYGGTRVVLGRRGREIAALVPIQDLESLRQLARKLSVVPPPKKSTPSASPRRRP